MREVLKRNVDCKCCDVKDLKCCKVKDWKIRIDICFKGSGVEVEKYWGKNNILKIVKL